MSYRYIHEIFDQFRLKVFTDSFIYYNILTTLKLYPNSTIIYVLQLACISP